MTRPRCRASFVGLMLAILELEACGTKFDRVLSLAPREGVYAYARVSPDGQFLAYASERDDASTPTRLRRVINVMDLRRRAVVFSEPGIDAYWSVDGRQMIYVSFRDSEPTVAVRDNRTGVVNRGVAPVSLGDYPSWGKQNGTDVIVTILGHYYYLQGTKALPPASIPSCPSIGVGERPLVSRDGRRVTVFSRGSLVVRDLTDCDNIIDTGMPGAKADFSKDGRYIAFHAPKPNVEGYQIEVVDLQEKSVRTISYGAGSSFFPSWTDDGRLCFRYDGDDYRGFVVARNVLSEPPEPLPPLPSEAAAPSWLDVFPDVPQPENRFSLVLIWATWSAHSPRALEDLTRARAEMRGSNGDVSIFTATDPGTRSDDALRLATAYGPTLSRIRLRPDRLLLTEGQNQMPVTLLFEHGKLISRRLGAQTSAQLVAWIEMTRRTTATRSRAQNRGSPRSGSSDRSDAIGRRDSLRTQLSDTSSYTTARDD